MPAAVRGFAFLLVPYERTTSYFKGAAGGPEARVTEAETIERGREVLRALGEKCHEMIRMRAIEDLSYRQVAERIGKSEGAARTIMYRCLQEARAILARLEQGSGTA